MIGNKEWFTTQCYFGRGLQPVCWQGWAYLAVFAAGYLVFGYNAGGWFEDRYTRFMLAFVWTCVFMLDILIIWVSLKDR